MRTSESAVSSVVGTVLMLGITVMVFTAFSVVALSYFHSQPHAPRTQVSAVQEGTSTLLVHQGGESLRLSSGHLLLNVAGTTREVPLTEFAGQVTGGEWRIGDSLCVSGPSPPCLLDHQSVDGLALVYGNAVIASSGELGGTATGAQCTGDTTPPTVSAWSQSPADVGAATVGAVQVRATVTDDCGVDASTRPHLQWRINDGSDPAYADAGAMTYAGGNAWLGTIPSQSWSLQAGKLLEYRLTGMKDLAGNLATSTVRTDAIQALCTADSVAPTVQSWTQVPTNVRTSTTGPVTVIVVVSDDCSGVDQSASPNLYYRLNDGTNPAFTSGGAMTRTAASTWQGLVPDLGWGSKDGKVLQYYVGPLKDLSGNTDNSPVRADGIRRDCSTDRTAPTIASWTQTPPDVQTSTVGSVQVTVLADDDCAGVDDGAFPILYHRVNDGSNPPYTNDGALTHVGTAQWTGVIPSTAWGALGGKTLDYYVGDLADVNGNVGPSAVHTDPIQASCTDTAAPTVTSWTQAPADVKSTTTGTVTVTAVVADECSGVDESASVQLWYRANDGTNPAFTQAAAMTKTALSTWQGTVPDIGWTANGGKTLEYEVRQVADLAGHTATSARRSDVIQLDCTTDAVAPSVSAWAQSPADVKTNTGGSVTVTVTLTDDCAGVDNTHAPQLWYRVNDGSNPSFTQASTPTLAGTSQWRGTVPAQTWGLLGGRVLEYELRDMRDANGNTGQSSRQADTIETVTTITYLSSATANKGSIANLGNAQSASDSSAVATLTEGATAGSATTTVLNANSAAASSGWTGAGNGFASDNLYASYGTSNPASSNDLRYDLQDPAASTATITGVVLHAEVSVSGYANDGFQLYACLAGTCDTSALSTDGKSATDVTINLDVTARRPGGGSWSWTDITNLQGALRLDQSGNRDGSWRVDRVWADVTYTPVTYSLAVDADIGAVPLATTQTLELNARVASDTFQVQVWDGTGYTTRGATLNAASLATWSYQLTSAEYNGGTVKVRLVDVTPGGTTQATLQIDYLRVTSV